MNYISDFGIIAFSSHAVRFFFMLRKAFKIQFDTESLASDARFTKFIKNWMIEILILLKIQKLNSELRRATEFVSRVHSS